MGVAVLEKIEACEDEIILTCSLDFDFELDDLKSSLETLAAAKEEARAEHQAEREEKHAALVKACPVLVNECGLPLEVPVPVEGELPDREAMKAIKKALKCVVSAPLEDEDEVCASFLGDMQEERQNAREEKPVGVGRPDEETIEMLKAVRTCLKEDVKPTLDEDSICFAALSRPAKPETVVVDPLVPTVDVDDREDLVAAKLFV